MSGILTYGVEEVPHNTKEQERFGCASALWLTRWFQVDGTRVGWEKVAIFNLDSEARLFEKWLRDDA